MAVFKSYDVRGVYPSEINEAVASGVAKAFACFLQADKIVIGRDARESSPKLHEAVVKALTAMGVNVYDIGECNTPLLNYAVASKGFCGGIMITASHNPKEYNALKLIKDGIQLSSPGGLDSVKALFDNQKNIKPLRERKGDVFELAILNDYLDEIVPKFPVLKKLSAAVDYSSGMGSITAKSAFDRLKLKVFPLNEAIDCTFPVHPANPEEKNLEQLKSAVIMQKADLGIFFDGDADRAVFVDEKGNTVSPDLYFAALIPSELRGRSDKRVYYDLRFTKAVAEIIKENKGIGEMMRVGNPFYKEKLKHAGGVMAGEFSGHVMFQEHYCIDDGLYASLKLLTLLAGSKKKFSEIVKPLQRYFTSPEINIEVKDPDKALKKVKEAFPDGKNIELDGVYISYPDWWFNLRKSNTEPLVRLRVEAKTKEKMDEMRDKIMKLVR